MGYKIELDAAVVSIWTNEIIGGKTKSTTLYQ